MVEKKYLSLRLILIQVRLFVSINFISKKKMTKMNKELITKVLSRLKEFIKKQKVKIVLGGVLIILLAIIYGIFSMIYSFFRIFFPRFVSIPVLIDSE